MQRAKVLHLSICNYRKENVCDLYDNQSDVSGQATDVYITTERNGWKELTFDIPSSCMGEEGLEDNYRTKYLINEYKIKAITENEPDWFIISEPQVLHSGFSKTVSVKAGHVSSLLKSKNLDLEFSDDEGNNVGTAEEILTTILEGTGWNIGYVEQFTEDDGTIKRRSISGEAGTGALSFIEQLCDAFDAKPVYHGDSQTVDILPMNPFDNIDPTEIPKQLVDNGNVLELHYNRNTHDLNKTTNTDNMATRLYAYGSSGDMTGFCSLQTAEHSEYKFTVSSTGNEYCFEDLSEKLHFFSGNVSANDILVYSDLDLTSQLYIWNETKEEAYPLYDKPHGSYITLSDPELSVKQNYFPFILGLEYYYKVGLMTDEQFQLAAQFQRVLPDLYQTSQEAYDAYQLGEQELSRIAEHNTGLLKLKISSSSSDNGYVKLNIDTSVDNGILFRTDYDVSERKYFQWHVAKKLQDNGDPVSGTPSVLLVIHNTNPVTWDKVYLKAIYDPELVSENGEPTDFKYATDKYPTAITVWSTDLRWSANDRVYLFCTNSMAGLLGGRLSEDEAVIENLYNKTDKHPTQFWDMDSTNVRPSIQNAEFEWLYGYHGNSNTPGTLYFCWKAKADNNWRNVYIDTTVPTVENNAYFYHLKYKTLWHGEAGSWVKCESAAEQRVADHFTKVFYYCRRRDMLYHGLYEYYIHNCTNLPAGNYAFTTDYAFYWAFKTDSVTSNQLKLDTINGHVVLDNNISRVVSYSTLPTETLFFASENELEGRNFYPGAIDFSTGVETDADGRFRSGTIRVWESTKYNYQLPNNSFVYYYDVNLKYLTGLAIGGSGNFTTPARTRFIRFGTATQNVTGYVRLDGYNTKFYYNDEPYTILNVSSTDGELIGINPLMKKFADLADQTYLTDYATYKQAQEEIKTHNNNLSSSLCDMIKDGRWQDSNYVSGDEKRLYDDAMDMLRQISMPEIDYSFTYLDMFGIHNEHYYEEHESSWPNVEITDMAHLIDPEIDTNCWAYIDKVSECYDKPWNTKIEIDTKLTLAARHGFTDVIARIAEIAKKVNSKMPEYDAASSGSVDGSRLEGQILLNQAYLDGGASSWHTDETGNIIFESADGLSAMMLGGRGLGVANSKNPDGTWQWRTATTGYGMTADEIVTGFLDAQRIKTGSITVDKLMSNVGQELEIGSNKALFLFATEDGTRPAGTLRTTDAKIEIMAGQGTTPARINVVSGGELNLEGGNIHVKSQGELTVDSTGEFTLSSKGAGLNTTVDGVYVGSDGINLGGGKFKVTFSGNTSTVNMTAGYVAIGTPGNEATVLTVDSGVGKININANNEINISSGKTLKLLSNGGNVLIGSAGKPFTVGSNGTNAYIYNGTDSLSSTTDGAYYGTDGIYIRGTSNNVVHYIKATAAGNIDISGKITTVEASIGGWTVGADYIGNAATRDSSTIGLAHLSSGIVLWAGGARNGSGDNAPKFSVQADGTVNAIKGTIGGWYIGSDYIGNANTKNGSTVGMANASGTNIVFWAGGDYNGAGNNVPEFRVTAAGKLYASDAEIKGTILANSTIACEISADKITSGTMSANRISGGTIDANNVTIVNLTAASISGGSLVLGGANNTNGTLAIKNANNVQIGSWNNAGITSIAGTIGGWTINEKSLSKGSGTSKIVLNADTTTATIKDYAFWVGAESPTSAGLRCKWDGSLYATKFVSVSEPTAQYPNGQETVINLSQYPLWKLYKPYISGHTANSISLSDGTTINFKTAADINAVTATSAAVYGSPGGGSATAPVRVSLSNGNEPIVSCDMGQYYSNVRADARRGYTQGTFTQYSGATLYTMDQSGPHVYSGTLYTKS